jgi:hypothetical protein
VLLQYLLKPEKVEIFNYVIEELIKNFAFESFVLGGGDS